MGVVGVHTPGLQHPHREVVLAGSANVIHDLVVALLAQGLADAFADVRHRLLPGDLLPLAPTARPLALQGFQDALGVIDLIDRRRTLGAKASTRSRVERVAFKFGNVSRRLVNKRE